MRTAFSKLTHLLHHPVTPGVLLLLAMIAALITANTATGWYSWLLETPAVVGVGGMEIEKPILLWINDGLMAIFFLLVGLELKREVMYGELSSLRKIVLPVFAAIGGIAIPAAIYVFINLGDSVALNGWAIPAATDIAFALGILAILGSRVPVGLKILLTSVAVLDDLAAIVIIAVFYTSQLSMGSMMAALVFLAGLFVLNRVGVRKITPYLLLGLALWVAVLKSGVHATLAGVALAMFIPGKKKEGEETTPASGVEKYLHSWVIYAILPVFAFANAGVPLADVSAEVLMNPIAIGIALGLFVGKPVGIMLASWLSVRFFGAQLPKGVNWAHIFGMAMLCGIGFTMSLFIGSLAFEAVGGSSYAVVDRVGILCGSFLSATGGVAYLMFVSARERKTVRVSKRKLAPTPNAEIEMT